MVQGKSLPPFTEATDICSWAALPQKKEPYYLSWGLLPPPQVFLQHLPTF